MSAMVAIVWMELASHGRRMRFMLLRMVVAAVLGLMLYVAYFSMIQSDLQTGTASIRATANMAETYFLFFGLLQLGLLVLLTPALLAPAIASEKERRTLDDVLTTRLSASEIVLGKLIGRTAVSLTPILVGMGLIGITVLFGGFDVSSIWSLLIISLATLFATAGISILASCLHVSSRNALVSAYFFIGLAIAAPYIARASGFLLHLCSVRYGFPRGLDELWVTAWESRSRLWPLYEPFGLFYLHYVDTITGPRGAQYDLWTLALILFAISVICVVWSAAILRSRRRHELDRTPRRSLFGLPRLPRPGRKQLRRYAPLLAKEIAQANSPGMTRMSLVVAGLSYTSVISLYSDFWAGSSGGALRFGDDLLRASVVVVLVMSAWVWGAVLIRASTTVVQERRQETMGALLATRLSAWEIVFAKFIGALAPIFDYFFYTFPLVVVGHLNDLPLVGLVLRGGCAAFVVALFFAALGVSQSLARRNASGSIGVCMAVFIFLHGVMQLLALVFAFALFLAFEQSLGSATTFVWNLLVASMPALLTLGWCTHGTPIDLGATQPAERPMMLYAGVVSLAGYLVGAAYFLVVAWREFSMQTGRTESHLPQAQPPTQAPANPFPAGVVIHS